MIRIDYPAVEFKRKKEGERDFIFDPIRKQWLLLTEEEWVRQNFIQFLIQVMNYPSSLIALEKEIMLGELKKRFDILVYDRDHKPWMMVECKGTNIQLTSQVLEQVLRYNISVPVSYLVITNGHYTSAWQKKEGQLEELTQLPIL